MSNKLGNRFACFKCDTLAPSAVLHAQRVCWWNGIKGPEPALYRKARSTDAKPKEPLATVVEPKGKKSKKAATKAKKKEEAQTADTKGDGTYWKKKYEELQKKPTGSQNGTGGNEAEHFDLDDEGDTLETLISNFRALKN